MGLLAEVAAIALPARCASCARWGTAPLCEPCLETVRWIADPICDRCGIPTGAPVDACAACASRRPGFRRVRAAALYAGAARDTLISFKLTGERRAARAIGSWMAEAAGAVDGDCVTFVPATRRSLRERGFNPAAALARAVARATGLPLASLLRKTRETPDQAGLGAQERRRNLAGAFAARWSPRRVLLVDDIVTTGATAEACAAALRAAGAGQIDVLAFARAP